MISRPLVIAGLGLTLLLGACGSDSDGNNSATVIVVPGENSLDAKRAEGERILGDARNAARIQCAWDGFPPKLLTACFPKGGESSFSDLKGQYFSARDAVYSNADGSVGAVIVGPTKDDKIGLGVMTFSYKDGGGSVKWYESEAELSSAIEAFSKAK